MRFATYGEIFDTENSICIGRVRYDGSADLEKCVDALYENRHGAFFVVTERSVVKTEVGYSMEALTASDAQEWKMRHGIEVCEEQFFADLPEAAAEREAGRETNNKAT